MKASNCMVLSISFRDRLGREYTKVYSHLHDAYQRLITLHNLERYTQKYAPTDSGDTRFLDCAERDALISKLPVDLSSLAYTRAYGIQIN